LTGNNRPWRGQKGDLYEGGTRVPTIVSWPDRVPGGKVSTAVQITDWMPTLTRLAGWQSEQDLKWDGIDILPLLTRQGELPERPLYAVSAGWRARSLRLGDWKLIVHGQGQAARLELFNLAMDPAETDSRVANEPDRVRELAAAMEAMGGRDRDAVASDGDRD
jgi:arylsulfatase A-like enzyme